jgi:hypothetical protein
MVIVIALIQTRDTHTQKKKVFFWIVKHSVFPILTEYKSLMGNHQHKKGSTMKTKQVQLSKSTL